MALDTDQQARAAADARIVDLIGAIVAGEQAELGRAPETSEIALALLDFVRLLAKQSDFTERVRIAIACRRIGLLIWRSMIWH